MITLCRNNPAQLQATLAALPAAVDGFSWPWQVLVFDGSVDDACAAVARRLWKTLAFRGTMAL